MNNLPTEAEIDAAIDFYFRKKSFSIIPLGVNEDNDMKAPSLTTWKDYERRQPTQEEIEAWKKEGLFKNIGVICGHVSDDLVIIDIDKAELYDILKINPEAIMKKGGWVEKTGKGYHLWLKNNGNPGGIKKYLKYSIEYRANNGYCAVAPSFHQASGNRYQFLGVNDYSELPPLETRDVKLLVAEMKKQIGEALGIEEKPRRIGFTAPKADEQRELPKCVEIALNQPTKQGMRYYSIFGIASAFYFNKIPYDMALQRIKRFNLEKCIPPHPSNIVEQAVKGAYEKDNKRFGCEFWIDQAQLCPYECTSECIYGRRHEKRELAEEYKIFTFQEKTNSKGEKYYIKEGVIPPRLAKLIRNEYNLHFFTMRDTLAIYYYNLGMYNNNGETIINTLAEEYMEDLSTSHRKNEVNSDIRDFNYKDRDEITAPTNLINVKNGILDINTLELLPHTPDYFFINQIPVIYDANASYEKFEKFLKHICMKEGHERPQIVATIQEYLGYTLFREYPFKNYIVLDGGGDNGKTVLMKVVVALVGEENNTSIGLQELNERPFAKAQLYAKYANVSDDLPNKALKLTGIIKQITGNSPMWADVKNNRKGISFTNYAKPWYACNELPETTDYTDAFFSRQLQITMLNKYLPAADPKIDNISVFERNVNLTSELTTEESLSGILNFALIGLKRLLEKKSFSDETTTDEKRNTWIRKTNPVVAYIEDEIELGDENSAITIEDFYSEILHFCERNGFDKPSSRKYVTERILDANLGIKKVQRKIDGVPRVWCWIGVKCITNTQINHDVTPIEEPKKQRGLNIA